MDSFANDLRFALRMFWKNPGFTLIAVLTLAFGMGANTAIFTVVNSVLLRPLPFHDPGRLFRIANAPPSAPNGLQNISDPELIALQQHAQSFRAVAAFNGGVKSLTGAGEPVEVKAPEVTANFWSTVGIDAELGRTFLPEEGEPGKGLVVVLSDTLWRSRFGAGKDIIGKSILLDGKAYTIVGVMPPGCTFPRNDDLWVPALLEPDNTHIAFRSAIGRLKDGILPGQAQAELDAIARRLNSDNPMAIRGDLIRMHPLQETIVGEVRPALRLLLGSVALLLLIASVNVANLLLARATRREQEVAVRYSLGATRMRVIRQLLTESAVLSLAGGLLGIVLAMWGVATLLSIAPPHSIPRLEEVHMDARVFLFTLLVSAVTSFLFGLWPAMQASRISLSETLKHGFGRLTAKSQRIRNALVVGEIGMALVLLTGAGLLVKSFVKLRSVDPGFRADNVITMTVHLPQVYRTAEQMKAFHEKVLERLTALPGVSSAAVVNWLPMGTDLIRGSFSVEGVPDSATEFNVNKPAVTPGYFQTMGIRLVRGRDFARADNEKSPGVMIIGQTTARRVWPNKDAIGSRVTFADHPGPEDWYTVIGVVDDVKQQNLRQDMPPAIYQPLAQVQMPFFLQSINYVVRSSMPTAAIAASMRTALHEVEANQPVFQIATMEDLLTANTAEPRFYSRLLAAFSGIALLLAVVGIYGVMAFSVVQRTREIGIRLALGANREDILASTLGRSARLITAGLALGVCGALGTTRLLASFLFEVQPTDVTTFVVTSLMLAAAAGLASYIPASRATKIDPMVALRYE
ncbi:MAG: ABC transporter permease [Acidobacteriia bacterium]|nr:ABC transporter permease [Terriglobia bacterium]